MVGGGKDITMAGWTPARRWWEGEGEGEETPDVQDKALDALSLGRVTGPRANDALGALRALGALGGARPLLGHTTDLENPPQPPRVNEWRLGKSMQSWPT